MKENSHFKSPNLGSEGMSDKCGGGKAEFLASRCSGVVV